MTASTPADLTAEGYFIESALLSLHECETLAETLGPVQGAGRRGLLAHPSVRLLAKSEKITAHARPHLLKEPRPVRAIYFNKSPEANWLVAWHQDLTIAVRKQHNLPGWGPWSVKNGVAHVQPPVQLLEQTLVIRIHLDDADEANGALKVLPGSHTHGRLSVDQMKLLVSDSHETVCVARAGDALVMRPLLLHSSARTQSARNRRVLHLEFAGFDLPAPLEWSDAA